MLDGRTLAILAALVTAASLVVASPVEDFLDEMDDEINGTPAPPEGDSVLPEEYPNPKPEGVQGITYWPDMTLAPYTWVHARATDNSSLTAWVHTTWTIGYSYYVQGRTQPNNIWWNHAYYVKALHWLPKNTEDYPSQTLTEPETPEWAQGQIHSPTYESDEYSEANLQIFVDLDLSGDPAMW
jgi:hypothetical protein